MRFAPIYAGGLHGVSWTTSCRGFRRRWRKKAASRRVHPGRGRARHRNAWENRLAPRLGRGLPLLGYDRVGYHLSFQACRALRGRHRSRTFLNRYCALSSGMATTPSRSEPSVAPDVREAALLVPWGMFRISLEERGESRMTGPSPHIPVAAKERRIMDARGLPGITEGFGLVKEKAAIPGAWRKGANPVRRACCGVRGRGMSCHTVPR
jgi:hypothetical protein